MAPSCISEYKSSVLWKAGLTKRMEEFLSGGGLSFLIAQSADPVAEELASAATAANG